MVGELPQLQSPSTANLSPSNAAQKSTRILACTEDLLVGLIMLSYIYIYIIMHIIANYAYPTVVRKVRFVLRSCDVEW